MRRLTVTEILDWIRCRQLWQYRHVEGLEPIDRDTNMVSGWVVHRVIQDILGAHADKELLASLRDQFADQHLHDQFGEDEDKIRRYGPGVVRALSKVPNWVWTTKWHVEERLTMVVNGDTEVVGRPDLFSVDETVDIVEFKTTETEPLEFLLWNPQHQYYGLMLSEKYPDKVVRFRYVCLPTSTKKYTEVLPWVFTKKQMDWARAELELVVSEVGRLAVARSRSRSCSFCDFDKVCTTALTGGQIGGMIEEYYKTRVGGN